MTPTRRNSAPVMRPWLIIWRIAPCRPCSVKTKMPSVTKPMWLTDE